MAFNFDSQLDIGGRPAWRFINETGQGYLEPDPRKAAQMGAPIPGLTGASANAAQLAPRPTSPRAPDPRLALAPGEDMTGTAMAQTAGPYQVQGAPPEAPPQVSDVEVKNQIMAEAAARQASGQKAPDSIQPTGGATNLTAQQQMSAELINAAVPLSPAATGRTAAGYVPQTRKVSGPNEELIDERRQRIGELEEQRLLLEQRKAARELEANDAEIAKAQREKHEAMLGTVQAQTDLAERERYYKEGWDAINRDAQEAAKPSADPGRFLNDKGFSGKLLAAVMIGIGEYGSRMSGGGPNLAHTIIQNAIDKDIQQQRDEIAANKEAVGERKNAFARELADGKHPKFAETKLKYFADLHSAAVLQEAAARARDPKIRTALEESMIAQQQSAEDRRLELDKLQQIEATEKWRAASSGMSSAKLLQEMKNRQEIRDILREESGLTGITSDVQSGAAKAGAVAKAQAPFKKAGGEETQQYQRSLQVAGVPEAEKQLDNLKQMREIMVREKLEEIPTPQSRNVVARGVKGVADFVGGQGAGMTALGYSDSERELVSRQQEIDNAVRKETFGAALSDFDKGEFSAQAVDTNKLSGIERRIAQLQRGLDATKASIAAGYNPGSVQTYEQRAEQYKPSNKPENQPLELERP